MRKLHAALLAAGGIALLAGTAYAAGKFKTMDVALPDGSVAQISYAGDVAPKVAIVPVDTAADPFAELDRMTAMMQVQNEAMMRQAAEMQQRIQAQVSQQVLAAQRGGAGQAGQIAVSTNAPPGAGLSSFTYTMVSTTSGNGCTQTVEYRSDGSGAEPRMTRTSAGDCGAVQKNAPAVPAAAPAAKAAPVTPVADPVQGQARLPGKST